MYYMEKVIKEQVEFDFDLETIMTTEVVTAKVSDPKDSVRNKLKNFTGMPVIDSKGKVVGVVSDVDLEKPGSTVGDVMTSPCVTALKDESVAAAACSMLKNKIHRLPVVDGSDKLLGIVTRTDVFTSMEMQEQHKALQSK